MQKYDTFATNLKGNNFGGESWLILHAFPSACAAIMHLHDKNVSISCNKLLSNSKPNA